MYSLSVGELTLRLVVAAVAGVALGLERELRAHPAGARTHALVAVGAALFTISGAYGFADVPRAPTVDPSRVAAQVASGIGFLGAGAILRQGLGVRGLTTAATLWLASAIGVASGAGSYPAVAIGTIVVLVVLVALRLLKPTLLRWGAPTTVIELEYEPGHGTLGPVIRTLNQLSTKLEQIDVDDETQNGLRHVTFHLSIRDVEEMQRAVDRLRDRPEVRRVRVAAATPPELRRPSAGRAANRTGGSHRRGQPRSGPQSLETDAGGNQAEGAVERGAAATPPRPRSAPEGELPPVDATEPPRASVGPRLESGPTTERWSAARARHKSVRNQAK